MSETPKGNGRAILALIAGIPVTMILASTWLWFFVVKGDLDLVDMLGTANSGSLVQPPRALADYPLKNDSGTVFNYGDLKPRWTFVVPVSNPCDSHCERVLYTTRQIHIAMGKELPRIQRFYVSDTALDDTGLTASALSTGERIPASMTALMQQQHKDMTRLSAAPEVFAALFAERGDAKETWYLVDPAGWLMMKYDESVHYKDVISDLKFLLKNASN